MSLSSSFRSDSGGSSARRIAVIGAQTADPESAHPYTVRIYEKSSSVAGGKEMRDSLF
jgi:hypothetical protein